MPSANTLIRWVNENAFAPIVRARPCSTFGRPVHQWGSPLDYGPVFLLMPFGFHLAMDTLPSGCLTTEHPLRFTLGCIRRFQLRARVGFPLLMVPRPARHYPRLRIWRPSSERQRDFNPPDLSAAQHTLRIAPPLRLASVFALGARTPCHFPLSSRQQVPTFRAKACTRVMPPIYRLPLDPPSGSRSSSSQSWWALWFRQRLLLFDTSSTVRFRSSPEYAPDAFTAHLAHYHAS